MNPNLYVCGFLVFLGIVANFLQKGYESEKAGLIIKPIDYLKHNPYGTALMVLAAYLLMAFWHYIGELTYITALLTGVGCNSAFDTLRARAEAKLQ